ncbi:hypothetical protein [Paraclostridium bifermentans]|uniref:hypothetical protein n=1 Tax=Paraclostridium bifermentans TaxID=1490 RepID=UPI00241EEC1E|nr:hypothetical protein [Paraclostridium bifermentans]
MLKINLNELRQYKVICCYSVFGELYYDESGNEYIDGDRDSSYICGFINNIYIEDGTIFINFYGVDWEGKFKDDKICIDISKIDMYKKFIERKTHQWENIEWNSEVDYDEIEIDEEWEDTYEVMKIKTNDEYDRYKHDENYEDTDEIVSHISVTDEFELYKDTNFEFIIEVLSYGMNSEEEVSSFSNLLLTDERISKILTV